MKKLITIVIFLNIVVCSTRAKANDLTGNDTYMKCKDSIAIIRGEYGSATGFLCEMDGKKYFITNYHVARNCGRFVASYLDGYMMSFDYDSIIEVAKNRDLVRFEVVSDRQFLKISDSTPNVSDKVEFYGNAMGDGVITTTSGKILAVGMDNIEINAPIQSGNSGSPLIRVSDGLVIGVTTFSKRNVFSGDPSQIGTRFDPKVKRTREFAVRFSGVLWESMSYGKLLKSATLYNDLIAFYNCMEEICIADKAVFEYKLPDLRFKTSRLNDFLKKIAKKDEMAKAAYDRLRMMRERNKDGMKHYGPTEIKNAYKNCEDKLSAAYKIRKDVLQKVITFCKGTQLLSDEDKDGAVSAFDEQYRVYCEKFRMELKGVFLE